MIKLNLTSKRRLGCCIFNFYMTEWRCANWQSNLKKKPTTICEVGEGTIATNYGQAIQSYYHLPVLETRFEVQWGVLCSVKVSRRRVVPKPHECTVSCWEGWRWWRTGEEISGGCDWAWDDLAERTQVRLFGCSFFHCLHVLWFD